MNNIVFLVVDCLRADVCYGKKGHAKTPFIRSLMRRGSVFEKMMSVATTTTPSMASILTGLYPPSHGIRTLLGYSLSTRLKTLAELLREAGYNTAAYVSGPLIRETGLDRGFSTYEIRDGDVVIYGEWGEKLSERLSRLKEPFFVFLHLFELHTPRRIDTRFNSITYGNTHYERALSSVDKSLERIFSSLQGNTTIILTGDHGENYYTPLMVKIKEKILSKKDPRFPRDLGHGYNLYDFLVNVPFIVTGPGISHCRISGLTSHVDVLPTICDIAGIGTPAGLNGISLLPAIKGEGMAPREVYFEACGIVIPSEDDWLKGIRTSRWKYIYAPKNNNIKPMLFDMVADPEESRNIVDKNPDVACELREKIAKMEREKPSEGESLSPEETSAIEKNLRILGYL